MMINKNMLNFLFLISVVVVIAGFFMPWVSVKSAVLGKVVRLWGSHEQVVLQRISGADIPKLANRPDSKLAIAIASLIFPSQKRLDQKSYALYLVVVLAVLCLWFYVIAEHRPLCHAVPILCGGLISGFGFYKLHMTDLSKLVVQLNIEIGLLMVLVGYAMMALVTLFKWAVEE